MEQIQEVQELSLEKVIDSKLVQNNVTEQVINALKEKYGSLKLAAIDDKESYLEIKAAAKDCAKVRTLATKICKEGREEAVKAQKQWIAKEKEVVGKVAEIEDALDAEVAKFDAEVERKATEEKNRQEEAYINRQAQLTKIGAVYSGGNFSIGETSFDANLIKGADQDDWEGVILPKFISEYEKIEAVRIKEEQGKAAKEEAFRQEQEKMRKEQEEFRMQQEAFKKQQEEAARLENERRLQAEAAEREVISKLQTERLNKMLPYNSAGSSIDMATLWSLSEREFNEAFEAKKAAFESEKAEKERLAEEERLQDIEQAKQDAIKKEQERKEAEERQHKIDEEVAEAQKRAELEAANDRTKWEEFLKNLRNVDTFAMKSSQYRTKMNAAIQLMNQILSL